MAMYEKSALTFYVNGTKVVEYDVSPEETLLDYLRRSKLPQSFAYHKGKFQFCGACCSGVDRDQTRMWRGRVRCMYRHDFQVQHVIEEDSTQIGTSSTFPLTQQDLFE